MSPLPATAPVLDPPQLERRFSPALAPATRRPRRPLLRALRSRQWLKNAVVLIAPATGGALTGADAPLVLLGAFVSFCLMSSATYLINDVRDRDSDRRHPRKRLRPVAAGQLSVPAALRAAGVMAMAALVVALLVRFALAGVVLAYAVLTLSYTLWWRDVVVVDVLAVAGGFLLRAVAGAVAVDVSLSGRFLVVTSACALFLVVGKRHAELAAGGRRSVSRRALRHYTRRGLRLLLAASAVLGCVAYASWSLTRPAIGPWLGLSLLPFGLWLGRYAALVRQGAGETPEELVLRDRALLALGLVWAVLFVAGIYGSA